MVVPLMVSAAEQDQEEERILQDVENGQGQQLPPRKFGSFAPEMGRSVNGCWDASRSRMINKSASDAESTSRKGLMFMEASAGEPCTASNMVLTDDRDIQSLRDHIPSPSQGCAESRSSDTSSIFMAEGREPLDNGLNPGHQHALPEEGDQPRVKPRQHPRVTLANTVKRMTLEEEYQSGMVVVDATDQIVSSTLEEDHQQIPEQDQCVKLADAVKAVDQSNQPNSRQHQRVKLANAVKAAVQSTSTTLAEDELPHGNGVSQDSNCGEEIACILQWFRTILGQVEKKGKIRLKDLKQAAMESEVKSSDS